MVGQSPPLSSVARDKVEFVPLKAPERFPALQTGEIDVLIRNTTWTLTRDTQVGADFAPPTFYDGQGFMLHKELGITSIEEFGRREYWCNVG